MSELQDYLATNPPIRETVAGYLIRDSKTGKEVLLGLRTRVSDDLGHGVMASIGGGLEDSESSDDALEREMQEEIRVRITAYQKVGRVICLSPHHPSWNLGVDIYLITGFEGEPKKTEDIDPRWYPKSELPLRDMWPDNRITAPLVLGGKRIIGSFLYNADGQIAEQDLRELAPDEPIPGKGLPSASRSQYICYTTTMKQTQSAGGVIVNHQGKILLINEGGNFWGLPKGRLQSGEDTLAAAKREIREEAGITSLHLVSKLGSYQRHPTIDGEADLTELKTITLFLFTTDEPFSDQNDENNETAWVPANEAVDILTHPGDKQFIQDNLDRIINHRA